MNKVWYLQRIDVFSRMTAARKENVAKICFDKDFVRHELILMPEDRGDSVYLIKTGRVKISRFSREGREISLAVLGPGEVFGEEALMPGSSRTTFAEAIEDSQLCIVHRNHFEELVRQNPELAPRIAEMTGRRPEGAQRKTGEPASMGLPARLAGALLELAEEHGVPSGSGGTLLDVKITHQDIANLAGSTRETVTAALNRFKREGLLTYDGREIILLDIETLRRVHGS
jgi:CRP/FNR family cyclic AMP-dependent transcriptional regulator